MDAQAQRDKSKQRKDKTFSMELSRSSGIRPLKQESLPQL